jgi:hypothetical protein
VNVLDECPQCGDKLSKYDDTTREEKIAAEMSSSDKENFETTPVRISTEHKAARNKSRCSNFYVQELMDAYDRVDPYNGGSNYSYDLSDIDC